MGNYVNKYFLQNPETEKEETEAQSASTDEKSVDDNVHTPVAQKTLPIDPRSVTSGINRTPIEVYSTPVGVNRKVLSAIPRHLQRKPYLETDLDYLLCLSPKKSAPEVEDTELDFSDVKFTNMEMQLTPPVNSSITERAYTPIQEERYSVLGIDPRSPAADFNRTPMLTPASMNLLKARHRENLRRRCSYTDAFYPRFSYCETSSQFNIPEIQALPDLSMCKVRSLNLMNNEIDGKLNESDTSSNRSSQTEADSENKEVESGSEDESKTISDSCNDVKQNTKHKEVHATDSDTIKIWRDPLILDESAESDSTESQDEEKISQLPKEEKDEEKISQLPKEEVIITFDDDSVAKLSLKLSKCENDKRRADINKKKKKVFKPETKIMVDEKKIFNFNDKNVTESTKIRTPLGNRSNNGHIQTILATNSPQQVIRNKSTKSTVSQENLSPHKYVIKHKTRGIDWDPDSTVII
ncbi:uncharacterized protein LOC143354014 isoform X2 [Halictus rubicundus]|uniref:uncharacterized protein LOC143354014 isoform X2 n=1 Tax=Halictus rubicundus TaxID=77578 RepID=UPI004036030C